MVEFIETSVAYWRDKVLVKYEMPHWEEVGQDKRWLPELDWGLYSFLQARGDLSIVVLMVDQRPKGYFVMMYGRPTHYRSHRIARCDAFYIDPDFRQYGVRLFKMAKEYAKIHGAEKLYVTWKVYKDIEPIAKRCGFTTIEKTAVADLG